MARSLFAALVLSGLLAAPTGSRDPVEADGMLVLGVAGHSPDSRVVSREWAAVANPRSGTTRKRRLDGGTLCHGQLLAVGGNVIFSGYRGRRTVARALPLTLRGPARTLGAADNVTPSSTPGRLWLGRWRRPKSGVRRWSNHPARVTLDEVDAAGRVSARTHTLMPRFAWLHAATAGGFVATEGLWLTLRRPGRDRPQLRVRDGWFAAAGSSSFAWCRGRCRAFHVSSRAGDRPLKPPAGVRPIVAVGAFSPDERRLAVGVTVRGRDQVAVVDLDSRRWIAVPGARLGGYRAIAWSPSGQWLYFTASNTRLLGWRVGAEHAVPLPIAPGGTVMSIATAETGRLQDFPTYR
ncbi:MAG: hypothetical protein QOD71_1958 [Thermoleophilaceae bacterium]|jgi:hypothetical protein|nr:hypothetical protein [Thermoleophilaceae bacterium]